MSKIKTRLWDVAEHLKTDEDMAAYLDAALEEGDPALFTAALGDIVRAKGIIRIKDLEYDSLYKEVSPESNTELATVFKIIHSLGLRLHATAVRAGIA